MPSTKRCHSARSQGTLTAPSTIMVALLNTRCHLLHTHDNGRHLERPDEERHLDCNNRRPERMGTVQPGVEPFVRLDARAFVCIANITISLISRDNRGKLLACSSISPHDTSHDVHTCDLLAHTCGRLFDKSTNLDGNEKGPDNARD